LPAGDCTCHFGRTLAGGALAKLVGTVLKLRRPYLDIEVITVGAPTVGDKEFCTFYDTLGIRSRDLMYLGNGLKTGDEEERCYWKSQGDYPFPCVYGG